MRITISYEYDGNTEPHFFAWSMVNGMKEFSGGDSWEQARKRHIEKLQRVASATIPPMEETIEL